MRGAGKLRNEAYTEVRRSDEDFSGTKQVRPLLCHHKEVSLSLVGSLDFKSSVSG